PIASPISGLDCATQENIGRKLWKRREQMQLLMHMLLRGQREYSSSVSYRFLSTTPRSALLTSISPPSQKPPAPPHPQSNREMFRSKRALASFTRFIEQLLAF